MPSTIARLSRGAVEIAIADNRAILVHSATTSLATNILTRTGTSKCQAHILIVFCLAELPKSSFEAVKGVEVNFPSQMKVVNFPHSMKLPFLQLLTSCQKRPF